MNPLCASANTPGLLEAAVSPQHWLVVLLTLACVAAVTGVHYEALNQLNTRMPRWRLRAHFRIYVMMLIIFAVHVVEIWIFALALYLILPQAGMGALCGLAEPALLDAVYLSATTYTTLGYGDLTPVGPAQFLMGVEALIGLLLITWSASFTYLEMQRYWRQ